MRTKDAALLLDDMIEEAIFLVGLYERHDVDDVVTDKALGHAVKYAYLAMGEAAKRVPAEIRDAHPDIPWRAIAGTRDVLAHGYDVARVESLWDAIGTQLIPLIPHLESARDAQRRANES